MGQLKNNKYLKKHCKTAIEFLSEGRTIKGLAVHLGVDRQTIYNWQNKHPEFKEAIDRGRAASSVWFYERIKEMALGEADSKNFIALKFLAQVTHKEDYREPTRAIEQKLEVNEVPSIQINFNGDDRNGVEI